MKNLSSPGSPPSPDGEKSNIIQAKNEQGVK